METMDDYKDELNESLKEMPDEDQDPAWEKLKIMMEEKTIVPVTISETVKAGAVAYLEGIRGFIPISRISEAYVEDTAEWQGKEIDVIVINVDPAANKLVLSGRDAARAKKKAEKKKPAARCEVGQVINGTVETIKPYGAFVKLENGLSGLLHVSQISNQRIKDPSVVLSEGDEVTVKVISTADNKISLSMKALAEPEESADNFHYKEEGRATTGLGDLLKDIKIN